MNFIIFTESNKPEVRIDCDSIQTYLPCDDDYPSYPEPDFKDYFTLKINLINREDTLHFCFPSKKARDKAIDYLDIMTRVY